ncbi:MAG: alpha/beta hydrolase [Syntrophobacteraceae bacterium]|nr:alpha/beta hydrolase [Syntrophobacteraceae bacterium]
MPFIASGTIDLHYEIYGEGPPLLFISGLGGSTWTWSGQIPFFKNHYRCILFDNRGAGLSAKPPGPYSIAGMAEDALRLLDCLRVEKTFVFSLSMGGMIALELARIASQRLCAMLLGCTHAGGTARIEPSAEAVLLLMDTAGLSREEILWKQTPIFFSKGFCARNVKAIKDQYRMQLLAPVQPGYAFDAQLRAIPLFDCTDALKDIAAPALVVSGTQDVLVPAANATYLAQHLPNAELIEIPDAGHALHVECRDFLNRAAHGFYKKHGCLAGL